MSRVQYSFTFTNAQQGAQVHLSRPGYGQVDVYATSDEGVPNDDDLYLDADNTVSVWADVDELDARTIDGRGKVLELHATRSSPTQTSSEGFASTFISGGSVGIPLPDERNMAAVGLTLGDLGAGPFPTPSVNLIFSGKRSYVGADANLDPRLAIASAGATFTYPDDAWAIVTFNGLIVTNAGAVPGLEVNNGGILSHQEVEARPLGSDQYSFSGQVWAALPADWAGGGGTDVIALQLLNVVETVALSGNTEVTIMTLSPAQ